MPKKPLLKRASFWILSLLFLIIALVVGGILLAGCKPALKLYQAPKDPSALLSKARISSAGLSLSSQDLAALLAAGIAGATEDIDDFAFEGAGVGLRPNSIRLAMASRLTLSKDVPLLGSARIPVNLGLDLGVRGGEKPEFTIKGAWLGRLPILPIAVRFATSRLGPEIDGLPAFLQYANGSLSLDLAKLPLEGIRVKSLDLSKDRLNFSLGLSDIGPRVLRELSRGLRTNRGLLEAEARSARPASVLAQSVLNIAPVLDDPGRNVGCVEYLEGQAWASYGEGGAELGLEIGDAVFQGGLIKTSEKSSLELRLADRSILRLSPSTVVSLDAVGQSGKGSSQLTLLGGSLRAKVGKLAGRGPYTLRRSDVVLGVRGTEFICQASEDGMVAAVLEGQVSLSNPKTTVEIEKGMEAKLGQNQEAAKAQSLSKAMRELAKGSSLKTPFSLLESEYEPDSLTSAWTLARQGLSLWNSLDEEERERLSDKYGEAIDVEALLGRLGIAETY